MLRQASVYLSATVHDGILMSVCRPDCPLAACMAACVPASFWMVCPLPRPARCFPDACPSALRAHFQPPQLLQQARRQGHKTHASATIRRQGHDSMRPPATMLSAVGGPCDLQRRKAEPGKLASSRSPTGCPFPSQANLLATHAASGTLGDSPSHRAGLGVGVGVGGWGLWARGWPGGCGCGRGLWRLGEESPTNMFPRLCSPDLCNAVGS